MYLNRKFASFTIIFASVAFLAGCNTVEGTVRGAGEDVNSVANAVEPHHPVHHRVVHKKTVVKKKTTTVNGQTTSTTTKNTTTNNSNGM